MRLIITINCKKQTLELPLANHHILQAVFYELMSDDESGTALHDGGYLYEKRFYKLFTFGPIEGFHTIVGKKIIYTNKCKIEFRSIDKKLVEKMAKHAAQYGIRFGKNVFTDLMIQAEETVFTDLGGDVLVEMASPICVYETDEKTSKTRFFNTSDDAFYDAIAYNFRRKYEAATGRPPTSDIEIFPYRVGPRDKYLTHYKNFIIEAYNGRYKVCGNPEYISFLYNTGLGAKNSQGFGMFNIV